MAIGDVAVGKTCLLWTFAKDEFPKEYVPTTFDNYERKAIVTGGANTLMNLQLWVRGAPDVIFPRAACVRV